MNSFFGKINQLFLFLFLYNETHHLFTYLLHNVQHYIQQQVKYGKLDTGKIKFNLMKNNLYMQPTPSSTVSHTIDERKINKYKINDCI